MIYEYKCSKCQKIFEIFSNYKGEKTKKCVFCGEESNRIISQSTFKFIARGEYYYDNKQK
jgi:putative FmdB family regulatory protein